MGILVGGVTVRLVARGEHPVGDESVLVLVDSRHLGEQALLEGGEQLLLHQTTLETAEEIVGTHEVSILDSEDPVREELVEVEELLVLQQSLDLLVDNVLVDGDAGVFQH